MSRGEQVAAVLRRAVDRARDLGPTVAVIAASYADCDRARSLSPEQILGMAGVDGRADIFSCGVMLFQFLTGEKPFTGSVTILMQKVLNEEPPPPTQLNPALSPAWDVVVRKAMAKKPADRYQSAAAFADAIRAAAATKGDESTVVLPRPTPGATRPS